MFGFRKAVLAFQQNQIKINDARERVHNAHAEHLALLGRRLDAAEQRIAVLERQLNLRRYP